jgi:pSer/pThr/pTyr-binding forkhead associated (FHA) protein
MNDTPIDEQQQGAPEEALVEVQETGEPDLEVGAEAPAVTGTRLVLKRSGHETDIVFAFSPPATIGRFDPTVGPVDVDLGTVEEGSYVSRKHARIVQEDDTYRIEDLGSSNGTYILRDDFEKVEEAELKDGDEISLGNARFVFHV